jgi:hypothetical protein
MTELALIKLTRPETASDTEALLARVERIERRLGKPDPVPTTPQATAAPAPASAATPVPEDTAMAAASAVPEPTPAAAASETDSSPEVQPKAEAPAIDISLEQLQKVWPGLFGSLRDVLGARRWAFFRESVPAGVEGNVILLEVPHGFHLQSLQEDDAVSAIVATRASDLLGGKVEVKFGLRETAPDGGGDQTIDMSQLEERPAAATDPTSLLAAELGAEVVEE